MKRLVYKVEPTPVNMLLLEQEIKALSESVAELSLQVLMLWSRVREQSKNSSPVPATKLHTPAKE